MLGQGGAFLHNYGISHTCYRGGEGDGTVSDEIGKDGWAGPMPGVCLEVEGTRRHLEASAAGGRFEAPGPRDFPGKRADGGIPAESQP